MQNQFEENIVFNPLFGAILLWEFTRKYETYRPEPAAPTLLVMMPVLPILFNQASSQKLRGMRFESGLAKVLADCPTFAFNLTQRIREFAPVSLAAINLACAGGLLQRVPLTDSISFATSARTLPGSVRSDGVPGAIALAARRLGAFFREETPLQIEAKLGILL
jgi:hypothetical protein